MPTTRKKSVINPSFTTWTTETRTALESVPTKSSWPVAAAYVSQSTLAQTSAATAPASRSTPLAASRRKKAWRGRTTRSARRPSVGRRRSEGSWAKAGASYPTELRARATSPFRGGAHVRVPGDDEIEVREDLLLLRVVELSLVLRAHLVDDVGPFVRRVPARRRHEVTVGAHGHEGLA
jgi:hypothetical protein